GRFAATRADGGACRHPGAAGSGREARGRQEEEEEEKAVPALQEAEEEHVQGEAAGWRRLPWRDVPGWEMRCRSQPATCGDVQRHDTERERERRGLRGIMSPLSEHEAVHRAERLRERLLCEWSLPVVSIAGCGV